MKQMKVLLSSFLLVLALQPVGAFAADVDHEVEEGESLYTISNRYYGNLKSTKKIKLANPKIKFVGNSVKAGTVLKIPDTNIKAKRKKRAKKKLNVAKAIPTTDHQVRLGKQRKVKSDHRRQVGNLNSSIRSWKTKHTQLSKDYIKLQIEIQKLKEYALLSQKYATNIKNLEHKVRRLERQIESTRKRMHDEVKVAKESAAARYVNIYSTIARSEEQIVKEKVRLLNQRYWIEKHKGQDVCKLTISSEKGIDQAKLGKFIDYLHQKLSPDRLFLDQGSNELLIQVSGRSVVNVSDPRVNPSNKRFLTAISNHLKGFQIEKIRFTGYSHKNFVEDESRKKVTGDNYILGQAQKLARFFIEDQGWSPEKVYATSYGGRRQSKAGKRFEIYVKFTTDPDKDRNLASITSDPVLNNIGPDILQRLDEPKYAKVVYAPDGVEIHIGQHYLFDKNSTQFSRWGLQKFRVLMGMLGTVKDAHFQFIWVPGSSDKNEKANDYKARKSLDHIYQVLRDDLSWQDDTIELGSANRYHKLDSEFTNNDDQYNRRLIVKIVPDSVSVRPLGESAKK